MVRAPGRSAASRGLVASLVGSLVVGSLVVGSLVVGCTVTRPNPEYWTCSTDAQCDDGFVCSTRAGASESLCVQSCATADECGDNGVCLPSLECATRCSFDTAGRPIDACPSGLSCSRLQFPLGSTPTRDGLCVASPVCSSDADCDPEGEGSLVCASSVVDALQGLSNLPCLAASGDGCAAGSIRYGIGCLPSCDSTLDDVVCPPGMACYEGRGAAFGELASLSVCFFGYYGAPCASDDECFVGRCVIPTGATTGQCTESCADAMRVSGLPRTRACASLLDYAGPVGARLEFECASDASDASCVAHGGIGSSCTVVDDCLDGLECREGLCTRTCRRTEDCRLNATNDAASGYCDTESHFCVPTLLDGEECSSDESCASSVCGSAIDFLGTRTCTDPRSSGSLCTRSLECLSGRCDRTGPIGFCS